MKKFLILALALGVSASAHAANPFSDLPAGHWAYASVSRLAAGGIIEGYGDDSFGGDRLLTRYEMAQITARAMAKGAHVERLAAEFAEELEHLGVHVAQLERKADNVKISGEVRFDYMSHDNGKYASSSTIRSRLWLSGQVNDEWQYTAMIQNKQYLAHSDSGDEDTAFKRAYVDGRIGGIAVHAGRWNEVTGSGNILDTDIDGVKLSYGDRVKIFGIAAKGSDEGLTADASDRLYVTGIEAACGAVNVSFNYFKAEAALGMTNIMGGDKAIYNFTADAAIAKDLNLGYEYMWADTRVNKDVSRDGYIVKLAYKGAEIAEAGSWGLHANYYDQPENAFLFPTHDGNWDLKGGYEGWNVGADLALAKNVRLCVNYYDLDAKTGSEDDQVLYSELYFYF